MFLGLCDPRIFFHAIFTKTKKRKIVVYFCENLSTTTSKIFASQKRQGFPQRKRSSSYWYERKKWVQESILFLSCFSLIYFLFLLYHGYIEEDALLLTHLAQELVQHVRHIINFLTEYEYYFGDLTHSTFANPNI